MSTFVATTAQIQTLEDTGGGSVPATTLTSLKTCAFSVRLSSGQSIANNTYTKVNFDSEDYDTDNAVSNGTFTCPSGKAGKYFFNGYFSVDDIRQRDRNQFLFYKNGANANVGLGYHRLIDQNNNQIVTTHSSSIIELSVGDYVQVYGQVYNVNFDIQTTASEFFGFKLI